MASTTRIGNLLVEAGIITVKTLERALAMQKESGKRLGALLGELGIVTEEEVLEALARQCNLPVEGGFAGSSYPGELLDLVPSKLAAEKMIFPLRRGEGALVVATLDPFDAATFERLSKQTGMNVRLVLATRSDIVDAIRIHYGDMGQWQGNRQNILLLEPSPAVAMLLKKDLERQGFAVGIAHDGIDGLKMAFSSIPDLVICDLLLPRMDGYQFMHALKAHPAMTGVPIILMTSRVSVDEEHRALKAGFADVIGKPAMPVRVLATITKAFAQVKSAGAGEP